MRCHLFRSGNSGFTLVEALLATLLMAIILGALATITAQWLPNWNRGMTRLQGLELFAAGLERLVADLAAAQYVSAGNATSLPIFDGTKLSVRFVRTAIGPNAETGLEIVRIAEVADGRGLGLVRMTAPFVPAGSETRSFPAPPFANPVVVIRSPYRVSFSYAGPDRSWRDAWRNEALLPRAVRISVRDATTSRVLAVSTSILIHAALPARCASPNPPAGCPSVGPLTPARNAAPRDNSPANGSMHGQQFQTR